MFWNGDRQFGPSNDRRRTLGWLEELPSNWFAVHPLQPNYHTMTPTSTQRPYTSAVSVCQVYHAERREQLQRSPIISNFMHSVAWYWSLRSRNAQLCIEDGRNGRLGKSLTTLTARD